jgi:hypothetical protein
MSRRLIKGDLVVVSSVVFGHTTDVYGQTVPSWETIKDATHSQADEKPIHIVSDVDRAATGYGKHVATRRIWSQSVQPFVGIVVGKTRRQAGWVMESDVRWLDVTDEVPVIMVQPLYTERWLTPVACIETGLTLTDRA